MMKQAIKYPKSWLEESMLLSLLLPPFGLAALFYAAKVTPLCTEGNLVAAKFYAHRAKRYVKMGFFILIGLVTIALLLALFFFFLMGTLPRY